MPELVEKQALLATISETLKEQVREALRTELSDALYCERVWSAWSVGTMRADDFVTVSEMDDYIEQITNSVLLALLNKEQAAATALARRLLITSFAELLVSRLFGQTDKLLGIQLRDTGSNPVTVLLLARNFAPTAGTDMAF